MENLKNFFKGPKVVFVILGVIIVVEVILALGYLRQSPPPPPPHVVPVSNGKISLLADKKSYKVGDEVVVMVRIATGGYSIIGSDVILRYPPAALSASSSSIEQGAMFNEYPMKEVLQNEGVIRISGINSDRSRTGFNGVGVFSTIRFVASTAGKATISVDFQPDNTADSNIIDVADSKDILGEVFNLDLNIQ